jgi:hypothetical protein
MVVKVKNERLTNSKGSDHEKFYALKVINLEKQSN